MSYRDLFALNDAASAVREHMERWDRLTRSSYAPSALGLSQDLTWQVDSSAAHSLAAQAAEATATATRGYRDLTKMDTLMGRPLVAQAAEVVAGAGRDYEALTANIGMGDDLRKLVDSVEDQGRKTFALLSAGQELHRIASLDRLIRSSLADIDWNYLHGAFHFGDELARLTANLTTAYRELTVEPLASEALFTLDRLPAVELYAHARLLRSLGRSGAPEPAQPGAGEEEAEDSRTRDEIQAGSRANLHRLLAEHRPDLLDLWLGAREALSNGHDSVRKYCSSQRALLKQLLLKAAPDSAVRAWTADPQFFSTRAGSAPSWRGRLAYLCATASVEGHTHFVLTDAEVALAVWKRLNQGEHEVPSRLTSRQVTDLQIRSNCLILMALTISIAQSH